ncbi:HAD domain-containing protein [Trinickia mobilis]|uniref:HAD domain-containing protein n=1 Tax=Trinickia mobilis TaxID=2816356 RepID=UPI001A8F3F55|nr:HAD domain-containing protein [Trinickia mobilis]
MERRRVLFLDIDGVLHRGNAYVTGDRIVSSAPGSIELFEYVPVLEDLLRPYPDTGIVFSTDWAYRFGVDYTREMLPSQFLRERVTGATYQGCLFDERFWPMLSRGEQVLDYVRRHSLRQWLAIDDRRDGFEGHWQRLVHCQSESGLGDIAVIELLRRRLRQEFS